MTILDLKKLQRPVTRTVDIPRNTEHRPGMIYKLDVKANISDQVSQKQNGDNKPILMSQKPIKVRSSQK
jgi:hypothetical protein